jgi:hypothetical protein
VVYVQTKIGCFNSVAEERERERKFVGDFVVK